MSRPHDVHVFADAERACWNVKQGRRTISRNYTQSAAMRAAARRARRDCVDVVTHGRNGEIRSKDSYGNESPTRDTER